MLGPNAIDDLYPVILGNPGILLKEATARALNLIWQESGAYLMSPKRLEEGDVTQ